ncbi:hypothetical protein, partial [Pseudomonas paraveronii]|uniref:hypothetical protein n=1 Tax=Pseudomonas paraveronii TaxID=3040598 RepID=UPI002AB1449F
ADADGRVARAAGIRHMRRTTLEEKMRKYGMSRRDGYEQADDCRLVFKPLFYRWFFVGTGIATALATFRLTDGQPSERA